VSEPQGASQVGPEGLPDAIQVAADTIEEAKAGDLLVLDVRQVASFTDYLVLCTATSDRHAQAVADAIRNKLRAIDVTPLHTEGYRQAAWILVDFVDFLVNVFTREARDFYQLERVWRDAPVLLGERPELPSEEATQSPQDPSDAEEAAQSPQDAGDAEKAAQSPQDPSDAEDVAADAADG